jgi:hypothetical protein
MIKRIYLTQKQFTIVDEEDYDYLIQWAWHANRNKNQYYAATNMKLKEVAYTCFMHNLIAERMGIVGNADHKNRDGLDNRRSNLRLADDSQNNINRGLRLDSTSGYKGVCYRKDTNKWRAYITCKRERISLGSFKTAEEAAQAYNNAAIRLFGEYAYLNHVEEKHG